MENDYILSYKTACQCCQKKGFGAKPENLEQVGDVLQQKVI